MHFYNLMYIVEERNQKRLSELAERFDKINGWHEKELLQFSVLAMGKEDIESKLCFWEEILDKLEREQSTTE